MYPGHPPPPPPPSPRPPHTVECTRIPPQGPFAGSIPAAKALSATGDVLLAFEMNGAPLTPDHGYPVRSIVPGYNAARSVKVCMCV
jgi:DMSO/TMAO reductase YedYZ molybdopterin-dependent catalytic subunit